MLTTLFSSFWIWFEKTCQLLNQNSNERDSVCFNLMEVEKVSVQQNSGCVFIIMFYSICYIKLVKTESIFDLFQIVDVSLKGTKHFVKALNRYCTQNFSDELISINLHRSTGITQQFFSILHALKASIKNLHSYSTNNWR